MLRDKESTLTRIIAVQKGEIAEKNKKIDDLDSQIADLLREKTDFLVKITDFDGKMNDFSRVKSDFDREITKNSEISRQNANLESQIALFNSEIVKIRLENDQFQHQIDSLTAELYGKSQECAHFAEIERKMSQSFQNLQEEALILQSKLKSEVFTVKLLSEKCENLENLLAEQKKVEKFDIKPWEERIKELQAKLTEEIRVSKQAENRLSLFIRESEEEKLIFTRKMNDFEGKLREITKNRNEFQQKCAEYEEIIANFHTNQPKTDEITNLQFQLSQATDQNLHLTRQITNFQSKIDELQSEKCSNEEKWSEIQSKSDKSTEILTHELTNLRIKLKAMDGTVTDLEGRLYKERTEKKQALEEVGRLLAEKGEWQGAVKGELGEYRAKIAYLEIELASAKANIENAAARIGQLQTQLETVTSENQRLHTEVDRTQQDLADISPLRRRLEAEVTRLRDVENDLERGVGLLETATQSLEGNTTCYACLELLKDAVMCLPCGHVYCQRCKEKTRGCGECGAGKTVASVIRVGLIDTISGKVSYSRQVIGSMRQTMERLKGTESD